jgi:hypothetical protein
MMTFMTQPSARLLLRTGVGAAPFALALHLCPRSDDTPLSPYHLMYKATIEDPQVSTRPWKMRFPLYRRLEPGARLMEFKCVEFADELLYGRFRARPSQ